jgi:hypothetical protein
VFLKSFFHIVVEKSFNIVKNKRAMAGKKANKKQVHPHLSGVQKAVVSFANMFDKNAYKNLVLHLFGFDYNGRDIKGETLKHLEQLENLAEEYNKMKENPN